MNALGGFPFMMQLVGYRMRTQAEGDAIDLSAAERGIETAQQEMRMNILETTYQELSDMDIAFIEAMLPGEGPSSTAGYCQTHGKKARPMPPNTAGACLRRASSACPDAERQASSCQVAGIHRGEARRGRNLQMPSRLLMKEARRNCSLRLSFQMAG
jgi:hypothetical protein